MKTLKQLLNGDSPSNYKEISQMIIDEHQDIKEAKQSSTTGTIMSQNLSKVLNANTVGFGPTYSPDVVTHIVNARLVTWQAGGTGISPQTFLKFFHNAAKLSAHASIPKENAYKGDTRIPASHLLDEFLRITDYYTELPDTDIEAFLSQDFIQLGQASAVIGILNAVWVNFCFNSANAIAISGIGLDASNTMGPDSTELIALKKLLAEHEITGQSSTLSTTVPALKIIDLIDFINDINASSGNINAKEKPASKTANSISGTPEHLCIMFAQIWRYLHQVDENLSNSGDNLLAVKSHGYANKTNHLANYGLINKTQRLIEQLQSSLLIMINRTRTLLSGNIKGIRKDDLMTDRYVGLSNITEVLESIAIKHGAYQKPSTQNIEYAFVRYKECDNSSANLLLQTLDELLKDIHNATLVERYAHIYIVERVPVARERLGKMHADAGMPSLFKKTFGLLPVNLTDKGLGTYIKEHHYGTKNRDRHSIFHKHSILNLIEEDSKDSYRDIDGTSFGSKRSIYDHVNPEIDIKESADVPKSTSFDAKAISKGFSKLFDNKVVSDLLGGKPKFLDDENFIRKTDETINEAKGLLRDTEKALNESPAFIAAKEFF
ncbi:MAG: hypothetical protein J6N72_10905, partial [Psychrobacter sp.]|nr:hypothetical protein [Psychrobacter sp.]